MPRRGRERRLATVLFTDIVGSTDLAADLGDRRWRELLARHHIIVRRQLKRFGGREVDTAGDGFFATFEGQADAIRCACAVSDAVRELGIEIRAGLHVGECEVMGNKVGGLAVHIGARVVSVGGPGEVLVSSILKDLVPGAGLDFSDHGVHQLKGIPGEWRLFTVTAVDGEPRKGPLEPAEAAELRERIQPRPLLKRRGGRVAAAGVAVAALAAGVFLLTRGGAEAPPRPPPTVPLDSVVQLDPDSGDLLSEIPIPQHPEFVAVGGGGVWVTSWGGLYFADPETGEAEFLGDLGRHIAVGSRWVWMTVGGAIGNPAPIFLLQIDPVTYAPTKRIPIAPGGFASRVAIEGDDVWVTNGADIVTRVNGLTGRVVDEIRIDGTANHLAVGEGAVWVADEFLSVVWRIDPALGEVVATISVPGNVNGIAAGEGGVWILDSRAGTVTRIDSDDNALDQIRVGDEPTDIVIGLEAVWVANYGGGTVSRIDPLTQASEPIDVGAPVLYLAVDEERGTLWLSIPSCLRYFSGCLAA